jgi:AraC-like DNA-binding protein
MIFQAHSPPPPLAAFVDHFWFYRDFFPDHNIERVLPDGSFELIIDLKERPRKLFEDLQGQNYCEYRRAWISGAHSRFILIDAQPASSMIGVHFKAGGASAFGIPAVELMERVEELEAIWNGVALELREMLLEVEPIAEKFRILEGFLMERLDATRSFDRIDHAIARFKRAPQCLHIREVAAELGISHKHLLTQFVNRVGVTPKRFCRIQRFQRVLTEITSGRLISWVSLANDLGYTDQAHFIHEFHHFSGINPRAYLTDHRDRGYFLKVDRRR